MINFLKGQPSSDLLPVELFKRASFLALDAKNADLDMLQVCIKNNKGKNNKGMHLGRVDGLTDTPLFYSMATNLEPPNSETILQPFYQRSTPGL
jgi:hypothetical protein